MSNQSPVPAASNTFERIKRGNPAGAEFWSSRDFALVLGYTDYRNFEAVIEKARAACFNSGQRVEDHFVEINEMIEIGKGGQRSVGSMELAASLFRTTQAEDKLRRENVRSKEVANRIHSEVGEPGEEAVESRANKAFCGQTLGGQRGMKRLSTSFGWAAALFALLGVSAARAETVSIVIPTNAAPRVEFGAEKLVEALKAVKMDGAAVHTDATAGPKIYVNPPHNREIAREGFHLGTVGAGYGAVQRNRQRVDSAQARTNSPLTYVVTFGTNSSRGDFYILSSDDSGALYGCLELAKRIRENGKLPDAFGFEDEPAMTLRGTCVGMQKTTILPGRKVYEYPYTPDLFPWFYDQALWREYLDFLVANRMNTLYLWNGHPFASLVRLADYPEAIEVPPDAFEKNVEMFRWLTTECDRRGIWLVQMFYNIFLPKPLAEKHGVSTQLSAPTPLASDYTRKSIAEFVKQYPNVGLMVCLGEALQGTQNQIDWATNTILPGVLDGLKSRAGFQPARADRSEADVRADALDGQAGSLPYVGEQPPVVIRTHAMNPEAIMPACFTVYSNLFTETKYNGESLTTYEPRGKAAQTHLNMAKLGPHLVNVHILSNLEPFRYGATEFIRKSVLASRDRLGASGIHLYPLSYWNWPYSPDIVEWHGRPARESLPPERTGGTPVPLLLQWERDWIWFEAWARYAWNPDVAEPEDRAYWISRLAEFYGNTNAAGKMLDAYNAAGEVAPILIRRFGITEGNRQTLSLGMTLDQLVNPKRYGAIEELWLSQAPPGERLDEFVRKEWNKEAHAGETPKSALNEAYQHAVFAAQSVSFASVTKNQVEYRNFRNDVHCILALCTSYAEKVRAAEHLLRYGYSQDIRDMDAAEQALERSLSHFEVAAVTTRGTYHFANSMQTGHRKIPFPGAANGVGTNYHWTQVLPLYQKELDDFRAQLAELKKQGDQRAGSGIGARVAAWPAAKIKLISTNAETYEVKVGARPFTDRRYTLSELAPELNGLTGIRFSHEEAKSGRYVPVEFEVTEPVRVLIGYFQNERELWLQVPNLDVASHADERGGVDVLLRNAAAVEECPNVNVHAFRYEPGRHKLELIGKGSFVVLGFVPQSAKLEKRDAKMGAR